VLLMLGATTAFVAMQSVIKWARGDGMDTTEVMFYRTAPGLPYLWWSLRRRGQGLFPEEPVDVLVRSILGTFAMGTNFTALAWLSVAQFCTLNLMQPVFVALASPFVLGERLRKNTWLALVLAFAGALVLVLPGVESRAVAVLPAALGLSSALFSAFAQMWVRKTTATEPAERVVFHFAAFVSVLALVFGASRGHFRGLPGHASAGSFVLQVVGMAGFGTLGQVLMTNAYSAGEASLVSLVSYSSILLSLAADVLFFGLVPPPGALAGAALMVVAGFVLLGKRGGRG